MGTPQGVDLYSYEDSLWGDLLTYWGDDRIVYDEIGNPTMIGYYYEGDWYGGYVMTWKGRQMMSCMNVDLSTMLNFTYNADGIRTSKTVEGVEHRYTLSGSQIISESWEEGGVEHLLIYIYDENGSPIGLKYRTDSYAAERYNYFFFEKNLQGDIIAIYNESGDQIGTYTYTAWGEVSSKFNKGRTVLEFNILFTMNPFRYRGYYYDVETGWYYLQSRYYNPEWGRFLNADGYVNANEDILGYNMFAYCGNNPIMGYDPTGEVNWRKFLDRAVSVVAACSGLVGSCVINNTVNAIYYHFSDGESDLEQNPEGSSYVSEGYIDRWSRLDYVKSQLEEDNYTPNAWRYYSEYNLHMYVWGATKWAHEKDIPVFSKIAGRAYEADIAPYDWDNDPMVSIATGILGIFGL